MKKNEWQDLYNEFDKIHSNFLLFYPVCEEGRNRQIRDDAQRKIDSLMRSVKNRIRENDEVYKLLIGGDKTIDQLRVSIYDEFFRQSYFANDMEKLLRQIKAKINNANE